MVIALYTLAWLLSGFLGAYIGWRFHDNRGYNLTLGSLIVQSLFGFFCLLACTLMFLYRINFKFLDNPVFKKEVK